MQTFKDAGTWIWNNRKKLAAILLSAGTAGDAAAYNAGWEVPGWLKAVGQILGLIVGSE